MVGMAWMVFLITILVDILSSLSCHSFVHIANNSSSRRQTRSVNVFSGVFWGVFSTVFSQIFSFHGIAENTPENTPEKSSKVGVFWETFQVYFQVYFQIQFLNQLTTSLQMTKTTKHQALSKTITNQTSRTHNHESKSIADLKHSFQFSIQY